MTAQKTPSGTFTSIPRRLCCDAPSIAMCPFGRRRFFGSGISRSPARNCPVSESFVRITCSKVPSATSSPPCSPAPGPRSTRWSAASIVPSSCSTTITVLPRSRNRRGCRSGARCRAGAGRSRARPRCRGRPRATSRSVWPADPLRLAARQRGRRPLEREVADAHVVEEAQALVDLAQDQAGDLRPPLSDSSSASSHSIERWADMCVNSWIPEPADLHRERLGRSRAPCSRGRGCSVMYSSIFSRDQSDSVSR